MTIFQLFLLILSAAVFYIFFKKLFTEDYPKRGIDFEATTDNAQIGGINRPDKTFSRPVVQPTRVEQLLSMADEAVSKKDFIEAKKAIESAMILDSENHDILVRYGYILGSINDFGGAKEQYEKALAIDPHDDSSHAALANALHQLGEENEAIEHHKHSIELDSDYAPHYFNYANTLYDLGRSGEALELYEKALALDPELEEAAQMVTKFKEGRA